jgi:1-acyl-sn-glycerol-3-phosphate acyltransferase
MSLNRYIAVDRGNKASHLKMFKECEDTLANGSPIMVFPEGTRSEDGEIHNFKEGAFKIALAAKVPILPIVLEGTSDLLPKHGLMFKTKNTIKVKILDPIPFELFQNMTAKELAEKTKSLMVNQLQQLKPTV